MAGSVRFYARPSSFKKIRSDCVFKEIIKAGKNGEKVLTLFKIYLKARQAFPKGLCNLTVDKLCNIQVQKKKTVPCDVKMIP